MLDIQALRSYTVEKVADCPLYVDSQYNRGGHPDLDISGGRLSDQYSAGGVIQFFQKLFDIMLCSRALGADNNLVHPRGIKIMFVEESRYPRHYSMVIIII